MVLVGKEAWYTQQYLSRELGVPRSEIGKTILSFRVHLASAECLPPGETRLLEQPKRILDRSPDIAIEEDLH